MRCYKKYYKFLIVILFSFLLLVFLNSCGILSDLALFQEEEDEDGLKMDKYRVFTLCLLEPEETEGENYEDMVERINLRLKEDVNVGFDISIIPYDEISSQYPILMETFGEYDVYHTISPNMGPNYYSLANQGLLMKLDDYLPLYGEEIFKSIEEDIWEDTRFDGGLYGIPLDIWDFNMSGFIYDRSLPVEYPQGELTDFEDIELYLDYLKEELFLDEPIIFSEEDSIKIYDLWMGFMDGWIKAPICDNSLSLACEIYGDKISIFHPVFSEEFLKLVTSMHRWNEKGYWEDDILISSNNEKVIDPVLDRLFYIGDYDYYHNLEDIDDALEEDLEESSSEFEFFSPALKNNKVIRSKSAKKALVVNKDAEDPERLILALDIFLGDSEIQNFLDLYPERDRISQELLESFENLDEHIIEDPFILVNMDLEPIEDILHKIEKINDRYGIPLLLGKAGDPEKALAEYRNKLKDAGIDKVIESLYEAIGNSK